jgi:predicted secreted Zn-dependent protease
MTPEPACPGDKTTRHLLAGGLLVLCNLLAISNAAAQVYKWTDEAGHVHYGDHPPESSAAKPMASVEPGFAPGKDVEVEETDFEYFEIYGLSVEQLRAAKEIYGLPALSFLDGRPYKTWGRCNWRIRWDMDRSMKDDGQCHINKFKLKLGTTITMGKWANREDGPLELQKKWDAFARSLKNHELGHKQNAVRAANEFSVELRKLPPQKDCAILDEKIKESYAQLLAKYKTLNNAWDQATVNGNEENYTLK